MYIWDIRKLRNDLREGPIESVDAMFYVFGTLFLMYVSIVVGDIVFLYVPTETLLTVQHNMVVGTIDDSLSALITLFGVIYIWYQNGANHGKYFMERFWSIVFVLGIRFLVLGAMIAVPFIVVFSVLGGLMHLMPHQMVIMGDVSSLLFTVVYGVLFIYRFGVHVRYIVAK